MIRLLVVLGVFLFMGMWFLGADHGQYINPPRPKPMAAGAEGSTRPVFVPAPRVVEEVQGITLPQTSSEPALQTAPELPGIRLMHVPAGATVRAGPGRSFGAVGALSAGDVVMVVDETSAPGWVRIRVDGRGEGWVAGSLLRE